MSLALTRRGGVLLLIALISTVTLAPPARARAHDGCAYAAAADRAAPRQLLKAAVVCLINRERREHGLPALRESAGLDRSAQGWSNTMVRTRQFGHGAHWSARITAVGFRWSFAGENIATGFASPRAVVRAWMASAGHCRNILDPRFSRVGTGITDRGVARYGNDGATWTQDFALPRGSRYPSTDFRAADGCPYRG